LKHLLDTHVAIWWLLDDRKLPRSHRSVLERVERSRSVVGLSAISLWEIARLVERGRLSLSQALDESLEQIEGAGSSRCYR
jgi:PIN domain nuclease of toxin-antitoxin system